jgi:hypothetical protein
MGSGKMGFIKTSGGKERSPARFLVSMIKYRLIRAKQEIIATSWNVYGIFDNSFWPMPITSKTSKRDEKGETHFFHTT